MIVVLDPNIGLNEAYSLLSEFNLLVINQARFDNIKFFNDSNAISALLPKLSPFKRWCLICNYRKLLPLRPGS